MCLISARRIAASSGAGGYLEMFGNSIECLDDGKAVWEVLAEHASDTVELSQGLTRYVQRGFAMRSGLVCVSYTSVMDSVPSNCTREKLTL